MKAKLDSSNRDIKRNEKTALTLPPDGYSRFFVITRLIEEIYKNKNKKLKILDVGGCSPYLNECLIASGINFDLTIIDILPKPDGLDVDYIQEDITKSIIDDGTFDVVLSTDVLEHIPKDLKDSFITSSIRLSKGLVIIAAPFDTEGVDEAEHIVNDFNKKLFGLGQDWLEEHFLYTKPSVAQTKKVLEGSKLPYINFGVNNLYSWILSTHTNLIRAKTGLGAKDLENINTLYNKGLASSIEFTEPTYRQFFVLFKEPSLQKSRLLESIKKPQVPGNFMGYVHGVMQSVYSHSIDLNKEIAKQNKNIESLNRQLVNEKKRTLTAQQDLVNYMNEKKNLRYFKKKAKSVVKKVIRK